ncbi:MAG: ABC transporter permease [Bacteroidota bacterium]
MISNYLLAGYRNLRKDHQFTLLNAIGLCLGLSVFVVMMLLVQHERSFDTFHSKSDRIFEVIQVFQQADGDDPEIWTSAYLSDALEEELSYVEKAVSLFGAASNWVTVNDQRFFEEGGIVGDQDFLEIFDFELLTGDRNQALKSQRSTIISEELAMKYFGSENPIGQVIDHEFYGPFTVTGVLDNVPTNSYFQFDYVLTPDFDLYFENVASWFPRWFQSWQGDPAGTYVLLSEANQSLNFEADVAEILGKHLPVASLNRHHLLNLEELHFGSNHIDGRINYFAKGDEQQVKLFLLVAFLILLMACANYVNITTARSAKRRKEVGIRKTVGALRSQLTAQFLVESFLIIFLSMGAALALAYLTMPYFNIITDITIKWTSEAIWQIMPYLLATLLLVTLAAGLYPAVVLSRFSAITILQRRSSHRKGIGLRGVLLVVQFVLVILLSSGLAVVHQQYSLLTESSLGYDSEHLAVIEINSGGLRQHFPTVKKELLQLPGVQGVTGLTRMFSGYRSGTSINAAPQEDPETQNTMIFYGMDEDGSATLGLPIVAGDNFKGQRSLDSASVLINESAHRLLGDVLGEWIQIKELEDDEFMAKVIGVVPDFHFESLHEPIKPVIIGYYINPIMGLDDIVVKVEGRDLMATMQQIEAVHNRYDTNDIMTWEFLDDMAQRAYEDELKFQQVFSGAALVSLIIALLGLVGLIAYSATVRTKEFGIRKVLGARFVDLFQLQSKQFIKYTVLASIAALPIAWWTSHQWLQGYAYRVELSPLSFAMVILVVVSTTLITAFLMGRGVARKNPVDSLRYE